MWNADRTLRAVTTPPSRPDDNLLSSTQSVDPWPSLADDSGQFVAQYQRGSARSTEAFVEEVKIRATDSVMDDTNLGLPLTGLGSGDLLEAKVLRPVQNCGKQQYLLMYVYTL
jgi:hypothetical protein